MVDYTKEYFLVHRTVVESPRGSKVLCEDLSLVCKFAGVSGLAIAAANPLALSKRDKRTLVPRAGRAKLRRTPG